MNIKIGDSVKTPWGNGTVTSTYKANGYAPITGSKCLMEWVDVKIQGSVQPMYRHHITKA
jgi:hypothetical protein